MNLKLCNIHKKHGKNTLFNNLSLSIDSRVLGFIGPSGSGKSSLLRMIAGLDLIDQGEIWVNQHQVPNREGKQLQAYRRSLGVVFQSWNLFFHMSAIDNIILPLTIAHGLSKEEAYAKASQLLHRFELSPHAHKKPQQLSGGQNQRIAILRAIAHQPEMILLDEPTSALDPIMTSEVLDLLIELKAEGSSFILITHHLSFLRKIADHILFFDEGCILDSQAATSFFQQPSDPRILEYLQKILKYE